MDALLWGYFGEGGLRSANAQPHIGILQVQGQKERPALGPVCRAPTLCALTVDSSRMLSCMQSMHEYEGKVRRLDASISDWNSCLSAAAATRVHV